MMGVMRKLKLEEQQKKNNVTEGQKNERKRALSYYQSVTGPGSKS